MKVTFTIQGETMTDIEKRALDRMFSFIGTERWAGGKSADGMEIQARPFVEGGRGPTLWEADVVADTDRFSTMGKRA